MSEGPQDLSRKVLESGETALNVAERLALARDSGGILYGAAAGALNDDARRKILAVIARDAEVRVRQALSETLARSTLAPRDIVLQLARDENLVATPVLAGSPVLGDSDLIDLLCEHCTPAKMVAIAGREQVSQSVSQALIENGDADVTLALMGNPGAAIAEDDIVRIVDKFGTVRAVQVRLVDRSALPALATERMIRVIAEDLVERLTTRHPIARDAALRIAGEVKERAVLGLTNGLSAKATMALLLQMEAAGDISYSFILRAICACHPAIIAQIIALRTHSSPGYVNARMMGGSKKDLARLWQQALLPQDLFELAHGMLGVLTETGKKADALDDDAYRAYVIDHTLRVCGKLGATFREDDVDSLLDAKFAGARPAG